MAGDELHPDDEALLDRLRSLADIVDPVPDDVVELGKAAFALHHADAIIMRAAMDELSGAGVRAARGDQGSSRLHVYEHGYFLVFQTDRGAYMEAFFDNIDWGVVNDWVSKYQIPLA